MKTIMTALLIVASGQAFAGPGDIGSVTTKNIVTCTGKETGFAQGLVLDKTATGYSLRVKSLFAPGDKNKYQEVKILDISNSPTSTKYQLEMNIGATAYLAVSGKQAVLVYTSPSDTVVEFLKCK